MNKKFSHFLGQSTQSEGVGGLMCWWVGCGLLCFALLSLRFDSVWFGLGLGLVLVFGLGLVLVFGFDAGFGLEVRARLLDAFSSPNCASRTRVLRRPGRSFSAAPSSSAGPAANCCGASRREGIEAGTRGSSPVGRLARVVLFGKQTPYDRFYLEKKAHFTTDLYRTCLVECEVHLLVPGVSAH